MECKALSSSASTFILGLGKVKQWQVNPVAWHQIPLHPPTTALITWGVGVVTNSCAGIEARSPMTGRGLSGPSPLPHVTLTVRSEATRGPMDPLDKIGLAHQS